MSWVGGIECLAGCDTGDLSVFAAEGGQVRRTEGAEGGRVPGGCGEGAVFDVEDEGFGEWAILGWVVGKRDELSVLLPVGVPGLGIFVVPFLLEDSCAVGGELDDEDAMDLLGDAAAAGVEALQFFSGVGRGGGSRKGQGEGYESGELQRRAHGRHRTGNADFHRAEDEIDLAA